MMIEVTSHYVGLLVYDYEEQHDCFLTKRNEIIIPKGMEIPLAVTMEIYPHKNFKKDKALLKIGITESNGPETNPRFAKKLWSELIHLDSDYPIDKPLQLICTLDKNHILGVKIINLLTNKEIFCLNESVRKIEKFFV